MRRLLLIAVLFSTPAGARSWRVETYTDAMTDKRVTVASVTQADLTLTVSCGPFPVRLVFAGAIGFGRLSTSRRFDNGPVVPQYFIVRDDGKSVLTHIARSDVARSSRLRLTIWPVAEPSRFYDLDLSGAREALAKVNCRSDR